MLRRRNFLLHMNKSTSMDASSGSANLQPRGRGRGRGMLSVRAGVAPKPGPQESKEKTVKEMVRQLQMNNIQSTVDFLTRPQTEEGQLQEILDETVDEVCNSVRDNIEFSEVGTELLRHLWDIDLPGGISIRKPLLTRIQALFKARDNLTDSKFLGYSSLLCDLFGCLTINSLPLNALVGPVYAILQDLLCKRGSSQDNMLTFHMLLRKHGPLLQKQDEEKMSVMMDKIRDMAIKDTKSKVHSCIYLELLELCASCWKQSESSERYYSDTLAELMATF